MSKVFKLNNGQINHGMALVLIGVLVFFGACQPVDKSETSLTLTDKVNVFLGSSGDHGQMSPSASYPFSMVSIGPVTNPHNHTGYEYYAKEYQGFVHTHLEGVGCTGSGGNILIKPILKGDPETSLIKLDQQGSPGYYAVQFTNGIQAEMTVAPNLGIHHYEFPDTDNGLYVDLSYALSNRFVQEEHEVSGQTISGWIDTKTTCGAGIYRIYYFLEVYGLSSITALGDHEFLIRENQTRDIQVKVGFSSVNTAYARKRISSPDLGVIKSTTSQEWDHLLGRIRISGEKERTDMFYSLLYRALQSPYHISEDDGTYRAIDGSVHHSKGSIYNGWAIWDNYREQLPLLSLFYPAYYQDIAKSIANLYPYGKNNWATLHEPSPTVRTEHALVVLLDAWNKGYDVPLKKIKDELIAEGQRLDDRTPDKALESAYDCWALSEILKITGDTVLSEEFLSKAMNYQTVWKKEFADLTQPDVDRMQARGLYQGTIWQYRWFVPFDVHGLKQLAGGEDVFLKQLDQFFKENNYNHANQPDLQVPGLYNTTQQPWKSQKLFHQLMLDTVVQNYFNNNSKGIDPYIGRIYRNQPKAYLRTMDDDAGTLSSWFVLRSLGLSAANVGSPVYYLTAPVFKSVKIDWGNGHVLIIKVSNDEPGYCYIEKVEFNGEELTRNWLTQQEILKGGDLFIETSNVPNKKWGIKNQFITTLSGVRNK